MKKVIFETFLGLLLCIAGFGLIFFSLTAALASILNVFLIILGIAIVFVGVFMLYKAGTKDVNKPVFPEQITPNIEEAKSILEKNNELVNEYNKTMRARDKLKILKMSASTEEK